MLEIFDALTTWKPVVDGRPCAFATIVAVSGSAPRPVGCSMVVAEGNGEPVVLGSLSGGCVEGAVVDAALGVLSGLPPHVEKFGYSDEEGLAVGLTCGGRLDVLVGMLPAECVLALQNGLRPAFVLTAAIRNATPPAEVEAIQFADKEGEIDAYIAALEAKGSPTRASLPERVSATSQLITIQSNKSQSIDLLIETQPAARPLYVVGANDFSAALISFAKYLNYRVVLIDARPVFASQARFAAADEVVVGWPHRFFREQIEQGLLAENASVCVLTHDPKFDIPVLDMLLGSKLAYLGAIGSRRAHATRLAALIELGHTAGELSRLHSPIGLDIGADTPEEVAVATLAEITKSLSEHRRLIVFGEHDRADEPLSRRGLLQSSQFADFAT